VAGSSAPLFAGSRPSRHPLLIVCLGHVSTSQEPGEWLSMQSIDPDLVRRVAGGEYEIDPHAVAEAMLRRRARLNQARQLSRVLVTRQFHRPPTRGQQP
jgi:hypothetical protein